MAQVDRVAPFLGFIFGTPFWGLLLKQFLFWSLQARPILFTGGPTASRQTIFWSTWMNVLWLCTWKGAEVLFCDLYVVQCEHL